jgi:hypothetical protein
MSCETAEQSKFCGDLLASGRERELLTPSTEVHPQSGYGIASRDEFQRFESAVGFRQDGPGDAMAAINKGGIPTAFEARRIADEATSEAEGRYGENFHNRMGDAWRHTRWSAGMTQRLDRDVARRVGDGHERENLRGGAPPQETNMDLFNNFQGRITMEILPEYTPSAIADGLAGAGYLQDRPLERGRQ